MPAIRPDQADIRAFAGSREPEARHVGEERRQPVGKVWVIDCERNDDCFGLGTAVAQGSEPFADHEIDQVDVAAAAQRKGDVRPDAGRSE